MSDEDPEGTDSEAKRPEPRRVRIPGFNAETEVGLGDVIKRATSLAGIKPCAPCNQRAAALNRRLVFSGRG
jgi:hypothetical protein